MSDFVNTTLFSTGCIINAFSIANPENQGVIVFVSDEFGEGHSVLKNNPAIKKLVDRFSAVFYDARGAGDSEYPLLGKISSLALSDDLKCVVNYAKQTFPNQPIFLFTASYGTITALLFMRRFPNEVQKLIIDSPILWPACPSMQHELMDNWKKNAKKSFSDEIASVIHSHSSDAIGMSHFFMTDEAKNFVFANSPYKKGTEIMSFYYAMQEFIPHCDLRQTVIDMAVETLLLLGAKDKLSPPEIAIDCLKSHKNSLVCISKFEDYGHKIYQQNSDEFSRICTEYLLG